MWPLVAIIAGIICLLHYLSSSKSQTQKPHWQDNRQSKAGGAVLKAMMSNSDGIDVLDDLFYKSPCYELQRSMCNSNSLNLSETDTDRPEKSRVENLNKEIPKAYYLDYPCAFIDLEWRKPILRDVMEALVDPNIYSIGVYGSDDMVKNTLLQVVYRRVQRDQLFGLVVTATVTISLDVRKIQEHIARQLSFTFNQKSKVKRANELVYRIKNEHNFLIVLYDLYQRLDLR